MNQVNEEGQELNFAACGDRLIIAFLVLAIVFIGFFVLLVVFSLSQPLRIDNPLILLFLLFLTILISAAGLFGFLALKEGKPMHKLTDTSLVIAGGFPWALFREIEVPVANVSDVKASSLWRLARMGWRHGRVYTLTNFVEIESKEPIPVAYLIGILFIPWTANVNRVVITVANREEFIRALREKCGLPPLTETA